MWMCLFELLWFRRNVVSCTSLAHYSLERFGGQGKVWIVWETFVSGAGCGYGVPHPSHTQVETLDTLSREGWDAMIAAPQISRKVLGPCAGAGILQLAKARHSRYALINRRRAWLHRLRKNGLTNRPRAWLQPCVKSGQITRFQPRFISPVSPGSRRIFSGSPSFPSEAALLRCGRGRRHPEP